jgi:hypothetical protein
MKNEDRTGIGEGKKTNWGRGEGGGGRKRERERLDVTGFETLLWSGGAGISPEWGLPGHSLPPGQFRDVDFDRYPGLSLSPEKTKQQ